MLVKNERQGSSLPNRLLKFCVLILVNSAVLALLFIVLEISYRTYQDGFPDAIINMGKYFRVPYSNLGTSNWVIYDDQLGYRLNPKNENINSLSIRHPEIVTPKPSGLFRIIFLGDSVPWAKPGFVDHIRDTLTQSDYEVINASVPGYTSYQEQLFFEKYLSGTDPDLVIWTYCLNDNHKFLHRFDRKGKMLLTDEAKRTLNVDSPFDRFVSHSYILSRLKLGWITHRKTKNSTKYPWESLPDFNIAWKDYSWKNFEKYLIDMKRTLDKKAVKLCIIVFPFEPQIMMHNYRRHEYDYVFKPQTRLKTICTKYAVPLLDLKESFIRYQYKHRKRLFKDGVHLTNVGHSLATRKIISFLNRKVLLNTQAEKMNEVQIQPTSEHETKFVLSNNGLSCD
jgi:lysophospholipase L1-like esterase